MTRQCAACGAKLPLMARWCEECGAPNPARRAVLSTVAVIAVLAPAIAIAIYAATRWEQPLISGDRPADAPLPSQSVSGTDTGFDWLSAAMKACDAKAAQEPNALHFLFVPLAYDAKDLEQWRRQALNRIGNAMVLSSDDMLGGLRRKALTVASDDYAFSIRDDKTQAVRKWERASGVKWLSATGTEEFVSFKMQYKPHDKGRDDSWGNPILHQKGNCYWVNAIYED